MTAPEAPDAPGVVRLVVDTNALIRRVRLDALASELYTVPSVLAEVKDDGTANLVEHMMPKEMAVKSPSPEAMAAVRAQAQKSGDLRSLSLCYTYRHIQRRMACRMPGRCHLASLCLRV